MLVLDLNQLQEVLDVGMQNFRIVSWKVLPIRSVSVPQFLQHCVSLSHFSRLIEIRQGLQPTAALQRVLAATEIASTKERLQILEIDVGHVDSN